METNKENFLTKLFVNEAKPALDRHSGGGGAEPAVLEPLTVTENGTYDPPEGVNGFSPVVVDVKNSGGIVIKEKDVNFYDYDGTLLHSYTVSEAQALSELPELPTQKGLICQGWNYDLETIKSYNRAVDVGATYITDDGKTRLYIKIAAEGRMDVPLYFEQSVANGVVIDWGDGSATETLDNVSTISHNGLYEANAIHTYADVGEYTITLNPVDECAFALGRQRSLDATIHYSVLYSNRLVLTKVELGRNHYQHIPQKAFDDYGKLETITIPNGIICIGDKKGNTNGSVFNKCYSLKAIVVPNGATTVNLHALNSCSSLTMVSFPNTISWLGTYVLAYCHSLKKVAFPNSITSTDKNWLMNCLSLKNVLLPSKITSIPHYTFNACAALDSVEMPDNITLISADAFNSCYSLSKIAIPNGVTTISNSAFYACKGLTSIVFPPSLTKIYSQAFSSCARMKFYDFTKHTAVPTLEGTSVFGSIPSDCEIRVPAALYDTWIAATNWSTYADYIVAV